MKNKKFTIGVILMIIGIALFVWGGLVYESYPGLRDMMKAAFLTCWKQDITGLLILIIGMLLIQKS